MKWLHQITKPHLHMYLAFHEMASSDHQTNRIGEAAHGAVTLPSSPPEEDQPSKPKGNQKLTLLPLIFLIYFEVSGGPYAEEPAVAAAGPLLSILGFIFFPLIWCIPEALVTAELATAFPGNGGYVVWADAAFGPFWGSLLGYWKFLSVAINNGAYLVLCADYLKRVVPMVFSGGRSRSLAIFIFNVVLTFLNYTGLTIVGYTAVALAIVSLLPFILMFFISIPKIHPRRWTKFGSKAADKNWKLYFTTLFWNLNFWDNASTLAGEVDTPEKTFPLALLLSGIIISIGYVVPLLAGTGALDVEDSRWTDGFLADATGMIAGYWLKMWVEVGAVLSTVGMFEAQLSSGSYQLLGTAELGFLPQFFAVRSSWFGTPWVGILTSSAVTLGISYLSFGQIISTANCLYSLGMLLEFSSFIWLRRKYPSINRPFRVGLSLPGLVCMLVVPTGFLFYVIAIAGKLAYVLSGALTVVGVAGYFAMRWCKGNGWVAFVDRAEKEEAEVVVQVEGA